MARQLQVADDLRPQQAHDVAGDAEAEAGEDLLGHGRAPEDVAALQDECLQTAAGEVRRGNQSVVSTADHDGVVLLRQAPPSRTVRRSQPLSPAVHGTGGASQTRLRQAGGRASSFSSTAYEVKVTWPGQPASHQVLTK